MKINNTSISQKVLQLYPEHSIAVKRARMNKIYDYDQNKYFDFYLDQGSVLLGYQHKKISTQLKNVISYGFYNTYPNHLLYKAQKKVKQFLLTFNLSISMFSYTYFSLAQEQLIYLLTQQFQLHIDNYSLFDLPNILKKLPVSNKKILKTAFINNYLEALCTLNLDEYDMILIGNVLANGAHIYTVLSKEDILELQNISIPIFFLQAIIYTLNTAHSKNFLDQEFIKLLSPYKSLTQYIGSGAFTIPKLNEISSHCALLLSKFLLSYCLKISSEDSIFFLCTQTQPHSLKYLMNSIKKYHQY